LPLWMDTPDANGRFSNLKIRLRKVKNAAAVCCFLTPVYQQSRECVNELVFAKEQGICIIPCRMCRNWKPTDWSEYCVAGLKWIDFCGAETKIDLKIQRLYDEILYHVGDVIEIG
ncbi:unnamed protein product, partial [Didymodactylos carnosus]